MADPSTSLKLLVAAIKSRSPVSFHYNKAARLSGCASATLTLPSYCGEKMEQNQPKSTLFKLLGLVTPNRQHFQSGEDLIWPQFPKSSFEKKKGRSE